MDQSSSDAVADNVSAADSESEKMFGPHHIRPTHDELLTRDRAWAGELRELHSRIANYRFDDCRFGQLRPETRSGSQHDRRLSKRSEEIITAAFVFGLLGYEGLRFSTTDASGKRLERPDFDLEINGQIVGVEVAQGSPTIRQKYDSGLADVEQYIVDLYLRDGEFASAFGEYYVTLHFGNASLSNDLTKRDVRAMRLELEKFFLSGSHCVNDDELDTPWFSEDYPTLNKFGVSLSAQSADFGPYLAISTGGTVAQLPEIAAVKRVVDAHRLQARSYRIKPTWLVMYLADSNEIFRKTVDAVANSNMAIKPFEKLLIVDSCWRKAAIG